MPDVAKKNNDEERNFEARIMREHTQKERVAQDRENRERLQARQRDINLITELEEQVKEKQRVRVKELSTNQKYIKMVLEQDEKDKTNQKNADNKAKKKRIEIRNFQLMQFGQKSPHIKIGDCFSYT